MVQADKSGAGVAGIEVIDWPQAERDKFRVIAAGAWKDFAAQGELARKAFEAHINYMVSIGLLSPEEAAEALGG